VERVKKERESDRGGNQARGNWRAKKCFSQGGGLPEPATWENYGWVTTGSRKPTTACQGEERVCTPTGISTVRGMVFQVEEVSSRRKDSSNRTILEKGERGFIEGKKPGGRKLKECMRAYWRGEGMGKGKMRKERQEHLKHAGFHGGGRNHCRKSAGWRTFQKKN